MSVKITEVSKYNRLNMTILASKTKFLLTRFGSTFGTLGFDEESFF